MKLIRNEITKAMIIRQQANLQNYIERVSGESVCNLLYFNISDIIFGISFPVENKIYDDL